MAAHHRWGKRSLSRLEAAHPDIRRFADACLAASPFDLTVLCVYRGETDQNEAFKGGHSHLEYPQSIHNQATWDGAEGVGEPHDVRAIDMAPVDFRWHDTPMWYSLCGFFRRVAQEEGIEIISGMDWNGNWHFKGDERFIDGPHWQLA